MFRGSTRFVCRDGAIIMRMGHELAPGAAVDEERRTTATLAQLRSVLDAKIPAIDRCFAARRLPRVVLHEFISEKHAANMCGVSRLTPEVIEKFREIHAPMNLIFRICAIDPLEQFDALDEELQKKLEALGGEAPKPRRKPSPRRFCTAREADLLEDLKERLGAERLAEYLGLPMAAPKPEDG